MPASTPPPWRLPLMPTSLNKSTTMPPLGNISPKARRCLENMLVAGPSTALELNALDPRAPDHRPTIKALEQSSYVVAAYKLTQNTPATYSLTEKAKRLLAGHALQTADRKPKATPVPRKFARPFSANTTPSISHGSMTTARMVHPCADMLAPATRHGAEQGLLIPSRVNDMLHYRDGRVVQINQSA